ncbi:MAG TPA: hypothetical protein DD735_02515 [Clostridiales bacterium]|nr:hypothetical protein [Clostridiales bacterium]
MGKRSGLPAILMELALMLLVFSLCAAVCLSVFAASRRTARESGELSSAAAWAQSAAEAYRYAEGDVEKAAALIGAEAAGNGFARYFDGGWAAADADEAAYTLTLSQTDAACARITVAGGGKALFFLDVKAVVYGG